MTNEFYADDDPRYDHMRASDEKRLARSIGEWEGRGLSHEEALDIARDLEVHPEYYDMFRTMHSEY